MRPVAALLWLLLPALLQAQDDMRDVVTTIDGKEVRGRVLSPTAVEELTVMQGGKRVRIARKDIKSVQTVGDSVREFLERRSKQKANPKLQWLLVEWAHSRGLDGLARLQALRLCLPEPGDERAHQFLGHRLADKGWQWPQGNKWLSLEQVQSKLPTEPMMLVGERFRVRCDGGLVQAIDALFDLERLGTHWFSTYGAELQLQETMQPMTIELHRNTDTFPKWGFRPVPYFAPDPAGDIGRTFYAGADVERPRLLFFVGTQALIYHTLAGNPRMPTDRDRICAWVEIGLGMVEQGTMQGPPGFAEPGPIAGVDLQAMTALNRTMRLQQLLHLPMYGSFYLLDDNKPATRAPFLDFVRQALGERKGDSNTVFDKAMGRRVEQFEEPLKKWLEKKAGY
jgi:hypothetical protein